MGIVTVAWIDSTVRVTIRQSDNVPIASEVAMAPSNLEDATGARLPSKPAAQGDRIIGPDPCCASRITRNVRKFCNPDRQYCGGRSSKMAKSRQRLMLCPLMLTFDAVLAGK